MIQTERRETLFRLLGSLGLALVVSFAAYWMAVRVVDVSPIALLAPFALLAIIIARRPILGFYVYFFVLFLMPFGVRLKDFPLLNSPLDIVGLSTIGFATARFILLGKKLPRNRLLIPWLLCVGILFIHALFRHGPDSDLLLYRFLQGSVPFVLIVLLLETPRQAKNLLIAGVGAVCVMVLLWLPFMIDYFFSPWFAISAGERGGSLLRACHGSFNTLCINTPARWLGIGGTTPAAVVALVVPLLLSVTLSWPSPKLRRWAGVLFIASLLFVGFATFFLRIVAVLIGMAVVLWINRRQISKARLMGLVLLAVPFVLVTPAAAVFSLGFSNAGTYISEDANRWGELTGGVQLLVSHPLVGLGGYFATWRTPDGTYLPAHNTFTDWGYKFGFPFLIALLSIFVVAALELRWLLRQDLEPRAKTLVAGFIGSLAALVFLSTFNADFGAITPDAIFWLFVGIAATWAAWLRRSPGAKLLG